MIRVFILSCVCISFISSAQSAFISGSDTICDNGADATVKIDFMGVAPYTFIYAIDGVSSTSIISQITPYYIATSEPGVYTLEQFSDANGLGLVSGSGLIVVLDSPEAIIGVDSDTLSIVNPTAQFVDQSIGDIISWNWNFGDNTAGIFSETVTHSFNDSIAMYQVSLIVEDNNGCVDTTISNIWIEDEYWIYIPNSFTPDFDMVNDKFCIEYNGIRESTFIFKVFDSNINLIFQSADILDLTCSVGGGWDGASLDNVNLPMGSYPYEIFFQDFEGWKHYEYGTINLIR